MYILRNYKLIIMFLSILYPPTQTIPPGFSNPPTDVRCSVRFKDVKRGYYYPVVTVTWGPPDFHAIPGYSEFRYEVYAEQGLNETRRTTRLFVDDIDLKGVDDYETGENVYAFSVRNLAKFDDEGDYSSAPARCDSFNTITRGLWIRRCV